MTTTELPTLDGVLALAQRLAPADQVRLIARLAPRLEQLVAEPPAAPADDAAWDELLSLADDGALPPLAVDSADAISASRR